MADDQHPADGLIDAIRGVFNGDNIKQSIRDAWDRTVGTAVPAASTSTPAQPMAWKPEPNAEQQQQIKNQALTPAQAAQIRAKAGH